MLQLWPCGDEVDKAEVGKCGYLEACCDAALVLEEPIHAFEEIAISIAAIVRRLRSIAVRTQCDDGHDVAQEEVFAIVILIGEQGRSFLAPA